MEIYIKIKQFNIVKTWVYSKLIYRDKETQVKTVAGVFVEMDKVNLKWLRNSRDLK